MDVGIVRILAHRGATYDAGSSGGRLATPEKALVDFLYLAPARSRLFRALPELELPARFSPRRARAIVARIGSARRRTMVTRALDAIVRGTRKGPGDARR
jgi:hypothetical protein